IDDRKQAFLSEKADRNQRYLREFVSSVGFMAFTGSGTTMPFIGGGQNNLYKCFIYVAFRLIAPRGRAALIHQDNHLVDPKAGTFRSQWYQRIRKHFHFRNAITGKMFA